MNKRIWDVKFKTKIYVRGKVESREWTEHWKAQDMPTASICKGSFDFTMPFPGLVTVSEFSAEPSSATDVKIALEI